MREYTVTWQIEVYADNPVHAAMQALEAQRAPDSMASVFDVVPFGEDGPVTRVDCEEHDETATVP
jgi:hypothetical protein